MADERDFGNYHRQQLQDAMIRRGGRCHVEVQDAVAGVLKFLDERLNDAAKAGCHHCHEGKPGIPCWWCGLKNRRKAP